MASFLLTSSGDLDFSSGRLGMVYDDAAILQQIRTRLLLAVGDWFRDLTDGTDWIGSILGKQGDEPRRAEIRRRVSGTPGVDTVLRIEITTTSYENRQVSAGVTVRLDSGRIADVRASSSDFLEAA